MARFAVVGAAGYVINLGVFTLALNEGHTHYLIAAVVAFSVAFLVNFTANRHWTFAAGGGRASHQAARFLVVSVGALLMNLVLLGPLVRALDSKTEAQAVAVALVSPLSFFANRLWTFRHRPTATAGSTLVAPQEQPPGSQSRLDLHANGHLRIAADALHVPDRNLDDLEAALPGSIGHLDVEGISAAVRGEQVERE